MLSVLAVTITFRGIVFSQAPQTFDLSVEASAQRHIRGSVSLGDVESGNLVKFRVVLVNDRPDEFRLASFQRTCGCIKVGLEVDQIAKPNGKIEFDVAIEVDKYTKVVEQRFQIMFEAIGCIDRFTLDIDFSLKNHLSFDAADHFISFVKQSDRLEFYVPITKSRDVELSKYRIEFDSELLQVVDATLEDGLERSNVRFSADASKLTDGLQGIVRLVPKSPNAGLKLASPELILHFSEAKSVRILPSELSFVLVNIEGRRLRQGHGIIRVSFANPDLNEIVKMSCESDQQHKLEVKYSKVRSGYYRFTVTLQDEQHPNALTFSVWTPNGDSKLIVPTHFTSN